MDMHKTLFVMPEVLNRASMCFICKRDLLPEWIPAFAGMTWNVIFTYEFISRG
jgi:hypothetical protein